MALGIVGSRQGQVRPVASRAGCVGFANACLVVACLVVSGDC
jgi:hypothetical protein